MSKIELLYIDEKGPQESLKMSTPFDKVNKIAYADDDMHSYVANIIKISESNISKVEKDYINIENRYLSTRNFKEGKELKGQIILKGNFGWGVASLKKNELEFYTKLFEILNENSVENLLFSINKMSLLVDSRLLNWILDMQDKRQFSAFELKYSLTKYAEIEASENVIAKFFDKNTSLKDLLTAIQKDLEGIVNRNKGNKRMHNQVSFYKKIIYLIKKWKHLNSVNPQLDASFNWDKVSYALDLWLTENKLIKEADANQFLLYLDQGIPREPFEKFEFNSIFENCISSTNVGIRITDMLVAIAGNYLSKFSKDTRYNLEEPTKPKHLSPGWFDFNQEQYQLIKLMAIYFFKGDMKYSYVIDTYFDEPLLFETFITYVSSYPSYEEYRKVSDSQHVNQHFRVIMGVFQEKWENARSAEFFANEGYGNLRNAIDAGVIRPL